MIDPHQVAHPSDATIEDVAQRVALRSAVEPGYEALAAVLDEALDQAQSGKGRERHASGEPIEEQPIVTICEDLGSAQFAIGQAAKKARESLRLGHLAARRELLGAINYLSAAVIVRDREAARELELKLTVEPFVAGDPGERALEGISKAGDL